MLLKEKIPLSSIKLSFLEGISLLLLQSRFNLLGKWSLFINSGEFHGSNSILMEEFPMHLEPTPVFLPGESPWTEDEMTGWHHWRSGHEFEEALVLVMDREAWPAAVLGSQRVRNN